MNLPLIAAAGLLTASAHAAAPWHHPLAAGRGDVWTRRHPITVENRSDSAAAGDLVATRVPALIKERIAGLRVCDEAGHELLFDVRGPGGSRREGRVTAEDEIVLPVECAPHAKATLYVYAGNVSAADPGEYLPAAFTNGGFEQAGAWEAAENDPTHRATLEEKAGRHGSRCAKVEIDPTAELKWTKWSQGELRVEPGRRYRVSGWVRGEQVQGEAGWFIHVNGDEPRLLNQSLGAGGGTFEWKRVELEFTAPPGAKTATFGTLLRGTGTAWFDDAEFAALDSADRWKVEVGEVETLELHRDEIRSPDAAAFTDEWPQRAVVEVLNLTEKPVTGVATVDLRPIRAGLRHLPRDAAFRVSAAASGESITEAARSGDGILFSATVPAHTQKLYYVHFSTRAEVPEAARTALRRLMQSPANLAPNPAFEEERGRVRDWQLSGGGRTIEPGHVGARALELKIPPSDQPAWHGWRSKRLPVEPRATYLFSAFAQAEGMVGRGQLFAHLHDAAGRFTPSRSQITSAGSVTGDSPWTALSTVIQTAPEAHDIELHLTTNATAGTLRHDGVFFCRTLTADFLWLEKTPDLSDDPTPPVWQVNPLIKVLGQMPRGPQVKSVAIECARNEYEPFELVLENSEVGAPPPKISVSPLTDAFGATLPPVKVDFVGYVPVDHPSAYYRFDGPAWHRPIPNDQGATDGWATDWPDPLIPAEKLAKWETGTHPVWFTAYAPAGAAPGEYHATITIQFPRSEVKIPLAVRVLPFALPAQTHLKVILDWRWGRGGDYGMGRPELKHKWLELMRDHRLGIDRIEPAPIFAYHAGKVRMDARGFDDSARQCFDRLGLTVCYLPTFFYSFGWAYPAKKIFGLEPFTPEFNDAFKQAYQLMSQHLREMGWHDRFVYYVSDEPHYGEPHVVEQMTKLCALAHEVDPTIPIYSSTWTHLPKWDGALDIWGAGHHGIFPVEEMRDLQARRKHIWFTCDGQMAIDTPYLATERTLPYYCHKYGAEGFEFWGLSWWTLDPWTHGWHSFISQSDDGKKYYSTRYPDGDGYLTYPGGPIGVDGPVSSIRLEQMREGIEDYEALRILEKLIAEARGAGRDVTLAEHALTAAHDLVTIPNSSGLRSSENLPDPDKLPAARKLVNAAIVSLMK